MTNTSPNGQTLVTYKALFIYLASAIAISTTIATFLFGVHAGQPFHAGAVSAGEFEMLDRKVDGVRDDVREIRGIIRDK